MTTRSRPREVTDRDYEHLLEFRTGLRRFLRWSEEQARAAGLTPAQHQLLLAVRGHPGPGAATVGDVAESLLLRHHSATELVDRTVAVGWLRRVRDPHDHRVVRLELTVGGRRALARLSALHIAELGQLRRGIPEL